MVRGGVRADVWALADFGFGIEMGGIEIGGRFGSVTGGIEIGGGFGIEMGGIEIGGRFGSVTGGIEIGGLGDVTGGRPGRLGEVTGVWGAEAAELGGLLVEPRFVDAAAGWWEPPPPEEPPAATSPEPAPAVVSAGLPVQKLVRAMAPSQLIEMWT